MPTADLLQARRAPRRRRVRLARGFRRRRLRQRGTPRSREPVGADPGAQGADEDAARHGAARPLPRRLAARRRRFRAPVRCERGGERHRRLPPPRPAERRREPARGGRGDHRRRPRVRRGPRLQPRARRARRSRCSSRPRSCPTSVPRASCSTTRPGRWRRRGRTSSSRRSPRRAACPSASSARGLPGVGSPPRSTPRGPARTGSRAPSTRSRSPSTASPARGSRAP